MFRLILFLLAVAVLGSCGKGTDESKQTTQHDDHEHQIRGPLGKPQGRPAIPDEGLSEFEKIANGWIKPYFDAAGTDTVAEVSEGEFFDIYIVIEFNELYSMAACEYRIVLPPGVTIMATTKSDSVIITVGEPQLDHMLAFRCTSEKLWLMKYTCKADEEFVGGDVKIEQGSNLEFLGFAQCDEARTQIRGRGGQAILRKK